MVFIYTISYKIGAILLHTKANIVKNFSPSYLLHKGLHIYLITWVGSLLIAIPISMLLYLIVKSVLEKREFMKYNKDKEAT